jgi:hypothetical protein
MRKTNCGEYGKIDVMKELGYNDIKLNICPCGNYCEGKYCTSNCMFLDKHTVMQDEVAHLHLWITSLDENSCLV